MSNIEWITILSICVLFIILLLVYINRLDKRLEIARDNLQKWEQYNMQLKIEFGELFLPVLKTTNETPEHTTATTKK